MDITKDQMRVPEQVDRGVTVKIVDDVAGFEALEPSWCALLQAAERPCIFLHWDWHRVWWQVYARPRDRLHIVTLYEGAELVALLPLYLRCRTVQPHSVLRVIGTGESRHEEVGTEYADLLSRAGVDEHVHAQRVDAVLSHLAQFSGWHRVELPCMLDDALLLDGIRRSDTPFVENPAGMRYRVSLVDGPESHAERLGSKRMRRIARARRAAQRDGGLQRHRSSMNDLGEGSSLLETLARQRRSGPGQRSTFESARFRTFHRLLCRRWIAQGHAQLVGYAVGEVDVASLYLFRCRDALHYYQSGFAPEQANRWMPLTLAHLAEIEIAREDGVRYYDLMRGEPPCYKDDFGCEQSPMLTVSLFDSHRRRARFLGMRAARRRVVAWLARINIRRA